MLTTETLKEFGANVREGLERCVNDEDFYLEMVNMTLEDGCFERLSDAIAAGDQRAAFEAAHALKGVLANVALTPLYTLASEITELLRAGRDADYPAFLARLLELRGALLALRDSE